MGIFDSDSEEEVKISPDENESRGESKLKDEVETEIVGGGSASSEDKTRSSRGRDMRKKSNSTGKSSFTDDKEISLEDIHEQNERIIELLESISGENVSTENNEDDNDVTGDLNGVL